MKILHLHLPSIWIGGLTAKAYHILTIWKKKVTKLWWHLVILRTEQSIIIKNKLQTWSRQRKVESLKKKMSLLNFSSSTWVTVVMDSTSDSLPWAWALWQSLCHKDSLWHKGTLQTLFKHKSATDLPPALLCSRCFHMAGPRLTWSNFTHCACVYWNLQCLGKCSV